MNKQKIEIYADFGTIPSLNFFLHFLDNAEDKETIRLFGLQRFSIPDSIINAYPKGIIHFCKMSELDMQAFQQRFLELVTVKDQLLDITIHANLYHSFSILQPLFNILSSLNITLAGFQLHLYDDGTEGVTNLARLAQESETIDEIATSLKNNNYNDLFYIDPEIKESKVCRYFWNRLFNATYHLLNTEILDKYSTLNIIKDEMVNFRKMDLTKIKSLSDEKRQKLLEILSVEKTALEQLANLSQNLNIILFLGTTLFVPEQEKKALLEVFHKTILTHYLDNQQSIYPAGNYVFCFKGHPHATEMNNNLRAEFSNRVAFLPDNLPLEVLLFWGFKPKFVSGFASTSNFYFTKEQNAHIYFITQDNIGNLAYDYVYDSMAEFRQMLIELGYVDSDKTHSHTEFYVQKEL